MSILSDNQEIQDALMRCWILAQHNGYSELIATTELALRQAKAAAARKLAPPSL